MTRTLWALILALVLLLAATTAWAVETETAAPSWCILNHEHCTGENCGLLHEHCVHINCIVDHDHCTEQDCKVDHSHCVHNNCIQNHTHCTTANCQLDHLHCVHNDCTVAHGHCTEANCQLNHQHCTGHYDGSYYGEGHGGCWNNTYRQSWSSSYYRSGCSRSRGHHSSHH